MKNILATLAFYASHKGRHSFDPHNGQTVRSIRSLEKEGYLYVNRQYNQAEFTGKVFSNQLPPPPAEIHA